jgi:cell division protein FtsL
MTFSTAAKNFVFLITVAILLLIVDLIKWQSGGVTWSEAIWEVNQHSLSFALGVGIVLGH